MKRIISFVLCLSMLLSMLPVSAFAADVDEATAAAEAALVQESTASEAAEATASGAETAPETSVPEVTAAVTEEVAEFTQAETEASQPEQTVSEETEETCTVTSFTWVPDMELPSDEALFAAYAEQQFYGTGISTLGTAAGETLDEGHKKIYDALAAQIRKIASGQLDSAVIAVGKDLGDVTFTNEDGSTVTYPCTPEEVIDVDDVALDLQNLLDVLLADFPYELYWFDKTAGVSVAPVSNYDGETCFVFYFTVSADYSLTGERYTYDLDTTVTGAASAAAENAQAIVAQYADASDYEKLVAYRDEICDLTSYNYSAVNNSASYGDPWQLIHVFDGDSSTLVVCEGYSKAFQYLCDLSEFDNDITCYNVVGTLDGGAHMWNILTINGSSYLVDVTNYDAGFDLFLRGGTADSRGGYTFDGITFVYDEDATALWGTGTSSILTLAASDFDPDSLTGTPETEPTTPETEPDSGEDTSAMTGQELVAILEAWTDPWYELSEEVVINSAITLPSVPVNVYTPGSITVQDGGSLTVVNSLGVANGGMLTVEEGGTMTVDGSFAMGGGSVATIDGTLVNNNYMNIGWGSLVVNGTYTAAENTYATVDIYGSISGSGIDTSLFDISATAYDEASLTDALVLKEGYGSQTVYVVNYDLDGDSAADPLVLTQNLTVPEGVDLQIGYYTGESALLRISKGVTLTNNSNIFLISDGSMVLEDGATVVNNGYLSNSGTIISYGTIQGEGTFSGNAVEEYLSQEQLLTLLESSDEITVSRPLTLSGDLTIPAGKTVSFEDPGYLAVPSGVTLTIEGNLNFYGTSLTVQSGGSLILRGSGYIFAGSALTIEEGASYAIEDEAEIYASVGTTLTGITKAEVVNSNMIMDPADNLQEFAETYGAGYKKFYLSIATDYTVSEDMVMPDNIVLDHYGVTVTIANGATLTVNGDWTVGMDATAYGGGLVPGYILVKDGELVVNGTMDLLYGSGLTIAEGSTLTSTSTVTVDEGSSLTNGGTVTVAGELTVNGSWTGNPPEVKENGSISGVPDAQDIFEEMLSNAAAAGSSAELTYDMALLRSLQIGCTLIVHGGVTLTVPEGVTLVNNGQIILLDNAALVVNGKLLGSLPCLSSTTARFEYGDGSVSFTQAELEAQLADSAETGLPVYVSVPLTLTKDLTVPEGAVMQLSGGVITIPAERILRNKGTIQMTVSGGITAQGGGTLANDGTITVFNRGVLDLAYGSYVPGEEAELLLGYFNEGPGTGIGASIIGNIYEHVTFLAEGWDEDHIRSIMSLAENMLPIKALQINVCGDLTLMEDLILPEYAALYIGDLGYGSATLTVPKNITLENNGSIAIGAGGTLAVNSGAALVGNLPVCLDGGEYNNANTTYLTQLTESTTLTGPTVVTGTLEIPSDITLTVSGKSAYLILAEGAQLINSGWIDVQNDGILDVTDGTYVNNGGTVYNKSICDADGNVTHATVLGVELGDMTFVAETYSDDAVIREMTAYLEGLIASGEAPDPPEVRFFDIRFMEGAALSGDLELPDWSDPVIPATGSLTVPAGMTLTDHSGMAVYGMLTAEGQVIATGWPMMVDKEETLIYPENCTNYYIVGKALERITVSAASTTAYVGDAVELWIDSWEPAAAEYFGDYDIVISGSAGYYWNEYGNLMVYSNHPETVTVTIIAMNPYGQHLYSSDGQLISQEISLTFVSSGISMFIQEDAGDFFEDGFLGLYPGSSLHFYGNLTGNETDIDQSLLWAYPEFPEDIASIREEAGVLTVTASDTLTEVAVFEITAKTADGSVPDFTTLLYLRPTANTVDVALKGETVTGQTVLFDLNRGLDSAVLSPVTTPADACSPYGLMADGKTPLVQWKSSNEKIATVDDYGYVTFTGEKTGKVKITMTANFGSKKTAVMTFNVVALAQEIQPSEGNADVLIGGSSATYTVTDEFGTALKSSAVKWSLCDRDGATIASHPYASVTAAGKLTTKTVADETKVYLMAQVIGDENSARLSEPVVVTLYPAVSSVQILDAIRDPINGMTLLYDVGSLGLEYPLSWTAAPYLESVKSVSWKSSKASIASIDENGLISVAGYDASGTVKFTLTVTALNGKKSTASFTMKFGTFTQDLLLSAILPDGEETYELNDLMIYSGQSITFGAENDPEDVTTSGVKWSVDNKSYATISSKGVLKAKTVSNPVTVWVLVESKDGAFGYEIPVTILPKQEAVVIWNEDEEFITKTTQTIEAGDSIQLYASEDVTWKSSKPGFADVDPDTGLLEAYAAGTTTITAATADGRNATFTLKVTEAFAGMTITTKKGEPFTVASGKSLTLVGTVEYENGSTSTKVTWSVDDASLATITSGGKLTAAKGLTRPGVVHVTATAKDSTWSTSRAIRVLPLTTAVEVFGPFGSSIYDVDISNTTQKWDMTTRGTQFTLSARTFPDGAMENVTWKSSSAKIATVDADGNVTCLKAGTVTITATAGDGSGKKASFKLTVHKTMAPGSLTLPETAIIGGGKSLTMTKLEGYGIDADATNKALTWTLSYPDGTAVPKTVATLSSNGVLKTKAVTVPVDLYITATATDGSDETAQCTVTIYPAIKGVTLYSVDMDVVTKKTVTVPVNQGYTLLPDATNVGGFGYADDKTADEYLPNGTAWDITLSKDIARVEFDGQAMTVYGDGATVGDSVKITLKAKDGSGKSAYFTVKFTEAASE